MLVWNLCCIEFSKTSATFCFIYGEIHTFLFLSKRCHSKIQCAFFEDECTEGAGCLRKAEVCGLFQKRKVCWLEFQSSDSQNRFYVAHAFPAQKLRSSVDHSKTMRPARSIRKWKSPRIKQCIDLGRNFVHRREVWFSPLITVQNFYSQRCENLACTKKRMCYPPQISVLFLLWIPQTFLKFLLFRVGEPIHPSASMWSRNVFINDFPLPYHQKKDRLCHC